MSSSTVSLIAYGCVSSIPAPAPFSQRFRRFLYETRDRFAFKLGSLGGLDFRNHDDLSTYNLGDHAIMLASLTAIEAVYPGAVVTPVNWRELNQSHATHDAIIICGSGYFFLDEKLHFSRRIIEDSIYAETHNLPVIIYGAGVNLLDPAMQFKSPQIDQSQRDVLRRLLLSCTHISVRDESSRHLLQSCTDKKVEMICDPALLLQSQHFPRQHASPVRQPLIGLNLPFHGLSQNLRLIDGLPEYIKTFKLIQEETGCVFQYMVHYDAEFVIAKMIRDSGVHLNIVRGDVGTLLKGYCQLNMHLGGMLHSCILATSMGVPCIGLAYDIKHFGFFEAINLSEFCVPTDPWPSDLIVHRTAAILRNESILREQIFSRKTFFKERSFSFLRGAISDLTHEHCT